MTFGILKIYYQITPLLDSAWGLHMSGKASREMESTLKGNWWVLCCPLGWGRRQSRVSGVSWRAKGGPCGGDRVRECCSMLWEKGGGNILMSSAGWPRSREQIIWWPGEIQSA